jgi:polyhydroxyalkanoate synthesis regulator phasin
MDLLKKAVLASVGVAYLTKEKVEEVGKRLSREANVSKEDARAFIDELQSKATLARTQIEELVNKSVRVAIERLNLPSRETIQALEKRVADLESRLNDS